MGYRGQLRFLPSQSYPPGTAGAAIVLQMWLSLAKLQQVASTLSLRAARMESADEMAEIRISATLKAEIAAVAAHYGQSPDEWAATAL